MILSRHLAVILLLFASMTSGAANVVRVSAADLVEVARKAVLVKASDAGLEVNVDAVGRVEDIYLQFDTSESPRLTAGALQEPWLRSRIGVPVRAEVGGRHASATVWLTVSAPAQGDVYTDGFPRGELVGALRHRTSQVDLARLQGRKTVAIASMVGMRLRRAVHAGDPVLASDFEAVPMVTAQQMVNVQASRGAVRLLVPARALVDGDIGQTISVLPANATRPVRVRVVSPGVVTLED